MTQTLEAIYANGVLRPVQPIAGLAENARVTIAVSEPLVENERPFANWVGDMPDEDADEMMRVIREEFDRVDPKDWR